MFYGFIAALGASNGDQSVPNVRDVMPSIKCHIAGIMLYHGKVSELNLNVLFNLDTPLFQKRKVDLKPFY